MPVPDATRAAIGTIRPIVYDVTRLFLGSTNPEPRGIDRVDLALAEQAFINWPGDVWGCLPTARGMALFDRARVVAGLRALHAIWSERCETSLDREIDAIHAALLDVAAPDRQVLSRRPIWHGPVRLLRKTGFSLGRTAVRHAPNGAIYLNAGQLAWAMPYTTAWLDRRPDLRALFMIHDDIPVRYPDLVSPRSAQHFQAMVRIFATRATGLVVSTRATAEAVAQTFAALGAAPMPVKVSPLSVPQVFLEPFDSPAELVSERYFVICASVEPRKNHQVLVEAWERLLARMGPAAPRLLVVGKISPAAAPLLARIAASPALAAHIRMVGWLSNSTLRHVVRAAQALLMPSLAEGFGLPVAEALALGTPVIASDIPVHREVGGAYAQYCPTHDPDAWASKIERLLNDTLAMASARARAARFRPVTDVAYFSEFAAFLIES